MRDAVIATMKQPAVIDELAKFVAVPATSTPAKFRDFLQAEQAKWDGIIKSIGYKE